MKVCLISSYPPKASGIGTYTSYLKNELSKLSNVQVLKWNYDSWFAKIVSPLINIFSLKKALNTYDIVHVQYHLGDFMVLFLPVVCLLHRTAKLVITLHEDYQNLFFSGLVTWFHNIFYQCADLLIVHTKNQMSVLSEGLRKKTIVIPHGVIERNIRLNSSQNLILLPGIINKWKGADTAIEAMPILLKRFPKLKLLIVGKPYDTKYAAKLEEMINDMRLHESVELHEEYVPEKEFHEMFRSATIAVLPHRRVTMSGILCHVISWNVPCVMSDLQAFKHFTKGKAIYFKHGEAKDLAAKMSKLLDNTELREKMSKDFKLLAREYNWKNTAAKTMKEYKKL